MSRVIVTDNEGTGHNYNGATGANYDDRGFLLVVAEAGDAATPLAVWAPGQWRCADLVREGGPTDAQEPTE